MMIDDEDELDEIIEEMDEDEAWGEIMPKSILEEMGRHFEREVDAKVLREFCDNLTKFVMGEGENRSDREIFMDATYLSSQRRVRLIAYLLVVLGLK